MSLKTRRSRKLTQYSICRKNQKADFRCPISHNMKLLEVKIIKTSIKDNESQIIS
jgi:hypothetical protein